MKINPAHIARSWPVFLFLLPVFFVWHGYVEYYDLITPSTAIGLIAKYLAGAILLYICCWWLFKKNVSKAALYSFFLLCLYFFFGSFQDFISKKFPGAFITRYSFLLPALLLLFVLLFFFIKRRKSPLRKTTMYLNLLMVILLLGDAVSWAGKISRKDNILTGQKKMALQPCPDCANPDIYFIVADGYSGRTALERFFNFDNTAFESQLRQRGFYVADSSFSNYNFTVFSVGSTLNMDYLNTVSYFNGKRDLPIAFRSIRNSRLLDFLAQNGYELYNYSIFDLAGRPSPVIKTLMDFEKSPLTTQTFLYRINKDIGYHLLKRFPFLQKKGKNSLLFDLENNRTIDSLTRSAALAAAGRPRFIYSHLMMPHYPYYFDSLGNRIPDSKLDDAFHADRSAYTSYLVYANKKFISLVDHIRRHNARPAIIVLVGDHGCRQGLMDPAEQKWQPVNFNAVLLPDSNYTGFYKGISNVNLFRVILNAQFGQHLPMLRDSATLIRAPY